MLALTNELEFQRTVYEYWCLFACFIDAYLTLDDISVTTKNGVTAHIVQAVVEKFRPRRTKPQEVAIQTCRFFFSLMHHFENKPSIHFLLNPLSSLTFKIVLGFLTIKLF